MSQSAAPKLKAFARRLLAYEAVPRKPAGTNQAAGFRVCEKLCGPLRLHLGVDGFRALLSRALVLGGAEVPWLPALEVTADGSLKGLDEATADLKPGAIAEGEVVLVSHLLGLLVTFIGGALTVGLVHARWPKADFKKLNFGNL
jgi:hypothetical protein